LALQRCEERNPPGSFLSWLTAFALADDMPAVVNPPLPAPAHYHEQLEASQSAAVTDWTEPPADAQAASVVSAEPDTAALDFAFTFPPPRAAELPDDHSQAALGSGGIPSSPAPPSNQLATGGGTACSTAPAPPSFANATSNAPASTPGTGLSNAQLSALLGTPITANALPASSVPASAPASSSSAIPVQASPGAPPALPAVAAPSGHVGAPPTHSAGPVKLPSAPPLGGSSDPLYILDMNNGLTIPAATPQNTFSTWTEVLDAQVSSATVSSSSWSTTGAPDATIVTGASSQQLSLQWKSFTGTARTDTVTLTTTNSDNTHATQTITFLVAGTDSPGYSATRPTTPSTWTAVPVVTPDTMLANQQVGPVGPYAQVGLMAGNLQTSYSMPNYNPYLGAVSLQYNSITADSSGPMFLVHYALPSTGTLPATVQVSLSINGGSAVNVTWSSTGSNLGDILELPIQGNAAGLATGRYSWSVTVTPSSGSPSTYNGNFDLVNQSSSPFGAGWSLADLNQLVSVTGGEILVQPGGYSVWFALAGGGNFTQPAGIFDKLVQNGDSSFTLTMPDGTKDNFTPAGLETLSVDRVGNQTLFNWSGGALTSITDMNGQNTTLGYSGSKVTKVTDPASRSMTLSENASGQLTSITGPDSKIWGYGYDASSRMTTLADPLNHNTTFTLGNGNRVTGAQRADGTSISLTPVSLVGWGGGGITQVLNNPRAALLAVAQATYIDGRNNTWTAGMDWLGFGTITTWADPLNETAIYARDPNALPWLSEDALGRRAREFFDSNGNVTKVAWPDDTTDQYGYNQFSEVTLHTDATSALWTYNYDGLGNLTHALDPLNHAMDYSYTNKGSVSTITDALNHTTTLNYDTLDRVTKLTDALNHSLTVAYDNASNVTSYTDVRGFTATFAYDVMDRLTQATLPDSSSVFSTYTLAYDALGDLTSYTDPLNHTTTAGYDQLNRQTSITDATHDTYTFSYDGGGNLVGVTNPLNNTWTMAYDAANRLTSAKDPLGAIISYAYDAASEITLVTDAVGRQWTYSWTPVGLLSSVTDQYGDQVSYGYDAAQFLTATTESAPGHTAFTATQGYDKAHRVTSSTDALHNISTVGYDATNNVTSYADALGHAMTFGYDALKRVTSSTDALTDRTPIAYDNSGNLTSVTDPLGRATTYSFDAQNRQLTVTDPNKGLTSTAYDVAGNLTKLTDPANNVTTYSYDVSNRLTSTTDPLGHSATLAFDAASEVTATTDRDGRQITYGYDAAMRQTSETWVGGNYTATYGYNAAGDLTLAQDPYSTYTYGYDNADRLVGVDNAGTPGVPHVALTYGYDVYNNQTSLSDSLGGSITYGFDGDHRLTQISTPVTGGNANITFGYDQASRMTGITRTSPSGHTITSALGYDNADRLTQITHTDSTSSATLASFAYRYDVASQLTGYTGPEGSLSYAYDPAGQLTGVSGARLETYTYDKNGNRTMSGYSTGTGNELLSDGINTYAYDKDGNLTAQTQISNGQLTTYAYDY
jgi:YD repeat-containing protein